MTTDTSKDYVAESGKDEMKTFEQTISEFIGSSGDNLGNHYKFSYKGIKMDPYRIFKIYKIADPAQQHAIKKLLRAGQSIKSLEQDISEVIVTLERWKEMIREDE